MVYVCRNVALQLSVVQVVQQNWKGLLGGKPQFEAGGSEYCNLGKLKPSSYALLISPLYKSAHMCWVGRGHLGLMSVPIAIGLAIGLSDLLPYSRLRRSPSVSLSG